MKQNWGRIRSHCPTVLSEYLVFVNIVFLCVKLIYNRHAEPRQLSYLSDMRLDLLSQNRFFDFVLRSIIDFDNLMRYKHRRVALDGRMDNDVI